MKLGEKGTGGLNSTSQIQSPDQTPSRVIDRFIRLKTRYWNRGFAIVLLTLIGLIIQWFQLQTFVFSIFKLYKGHYDDFQIGQYLGFGLYFGYIPGGILATVYPAHKVFGISFIISSICHIMEAMNYTNEQLHSVSLFCIGMTLSMAMSASLRVYTFWVPQSKQSILHIPVVLCTMIINNKIKIYDTDYIQQILGIVGITWFVLWLIVVSVDPSWNPNQGLILQDPCKGTNISPSSSGTDVVSLRRPPSTILEIPWKSFCTSMPFIALVLSYMCYATLNILRHPYSYHLKFDYLLSNHTIILLLLFFVLVELIPEITVCFSVTNIRKIFSCSFLVSMSILFYLEAFPNTNVLFLDTNTFVNFILDLLPYLSLFGFEFNFLDIAPQYSSVLYSILNIICSITWIYSRKVVITYLGYEIYEDIQIRIVMAVICLVVAVFYAIFASAELQPWARDNPLKENQQNKQKEGNLTTV